MTSRKTILIVDDHEDVLLSLAEILDAAGYQVYTARDGHEAVDSVRSRPFCFVLMDVRMPRKDGVQALAEIRELRPETPVALVSVYDMQGSARRLLNLGAVAVLSKPIDIVNLMGLLNKYCGQPGKESNG